ncbi:MAG: hypothetical protein IKA36_04245 [Clostridia bacterium]|nr:hypothetical protein [Clostridia bacterium]
MKKEEKLSCEIKYMGNKPVYIEELKKTIFVRDYKSFVVTEDSPIKMISLLGGKNYVGELTAPEDYQGHFLICDVPDKKVRDVLVEKFFKEYKEILISQAVNDPKKMESINTKIEEWKAIDTKRFDEMHGQLETSNGI